MIFYSVYDSEYRNSQRQHTVKGKHQNTAIQPKGKVQHSNPTLIVSIFDSTPCDLLADIVEENSGK